MNKNSLFLYPSVYAGCIDIFKKNGNFHSFALPIMYYSIFFYIYYYIAYFFFEVKSNILEKTSLKK